MTKILKYYFDEFVVIKKNFLIRDFTLIILMNSCYWVKLLQWITIPNKIVERRLPCKKRVVSQILVIMEIF